MTDKTESGIGPMFNEEEQATGLGGVTVQDAWIGLQLLEKATASGVIQPVEFAVMSQWRTNMVEAIKRAIGKDYNEESAIQHQKHLAARQLAQQAAEAERADTDETTSN